MIGGLPGLLQGASLYDHITAPERGGSRVGFTWYMLLDLVFVTSGLQMKRITQLIYIYKNELSKPPPPLIGAAAG